MKYFNFFDLEIKFHLDTDFLRQKFLENSRKYHPDFFASEDDALQEEMMQKSSLNNEAFKVLSDSFQRAQYILKNAEILKEGDNKLPQEFLMEMMEFNEKLADVQTEGEPEELVKISNEADAILEQIEEQLTSYQQKCDALSPKSEDWNNFALRVKEFYLKRKYLLRIKKSLSKFATS